MPEPEGIPSDVIKTAANNQQVENQESNNQDNINDISPKRRSNSLFDTRVSLYPDAPILSGSGGYTVSKKTGQKFENTKT